MNLPRFSVDNPVAVNLLMAGIIASGLYFWFTLVREFFPALDAEQISIIVPFPGATPEDVERAITLRIEREIRDIDGIKEIRSSVLEGLTAVVVTMEDDADRERVLNSIRSEIDQVKPEFPESAEDPEIVEVRPYVPVISIVVTGDVPEERLRQAAFDARDDLLDLEGVSEVYVLGVRRPEIWAEVLPEKLEEHGLTFDQVGRALAAGNLDAPGGQLKSATGNVRIRTMGEARRAAELEELVVEARPDGTALRLADVARLRDTFEDRVMQSRFGGKPAVSLVVFKTPEQDALDIAAKVKAYVAAHGELLGGAATLRVTNDLSRFIGQRLDLMLRNARSGLILIIISLALFLSVRTSFWVALGMPVALLGAFTVMALWGTTINLLSLFALIIVLGMLVDDAIVIGENIHAKIDEGMPPAEAAVQGANEVAMPVLAAVLTTIIAFLPLAFIRGIWGDFLGVIPVVVIAALSVSLVEAFLILPSHLGHPRRLPRRFLFRTRALAARVAAARDELLDRRLKNSFERLVRFILRWRYPVAASSLGVFFAILGLVAGGIVPFVLIQDIDAEAVTVNLEMAAGTPEERTVEVIADLERMVQEYAEVASVYSVAGASFNDRGQENVADPATIGQLRIELLTGEERELRGLRSSARIIEEMRARSAAISGVDRLAFRAESGGQRGADIEARVRSEDLEQASRAADRVRELLAGYGGVSEVEKDLREGKLEARFRLQDGARSLGLTTQGLAAQLRNAVFGFEAQELQEKEDEVKVRVLLPEAARRDLADLGRLRIATDGGGRVPLDEVAVLSTARGYAMLQRADGKRAVTVTAQVDKARANVEEITADLSERLAGIGQEFPGVSVSFEGLEKERREALGSLAIGFPAALLGIYALIAVLFRSYTQPLIVMAVIPFSLVGAVLGHYLTGYPFTLLSMIGAVGLAGIVVNDSLILVHRVNHDRAQGAPLFEAVVESARIRLRPIILTTVTTVAGLFPLMLEQSFQAQFLIPMAVSLVFGLLFATVITLVILPTFYLIFEDLKNCLRWLATGRFTAPRAPAGAEQAG
ncbi:MAG: efflux RND transporter permease subunit [Planctomycetes bacterium]|nr:efflux RND transporter permease subunit [Planctomycetota bacterium]